jgi:hypothetical protein
MIAGKPERMRLVNEALIRGALELRGQASTAELVADTGLSQTTVGSSLAQMLARGRVADAGKRSSSGGRPASAWTLSPAASTSLALVIEGDALSWGLADALGQLVEQGSQPVKTEALAEALELARRLAEGAGGYEPRALAVGVPGTLREGRIITGDFIEAWADIDLQARFAAETGLPALVESDLCATALGCARAAGDGLPGLVYIQFHDGACAGSGLVLEGRLHRGAFNFAGELGYLPMGGGRVLDELIAPGAPDEGYVEAIVAALLSVNCVLNPGHLAVGGRDFRFGLSARIRGRFEALVEGELRPGLVFVEEGLPHYLSGLARLAVELIHPRLSLVEGGHPREAGPRRPA